jgi:hypothetical protein
LSTIEATAKRDVNARTVELVELLTQVGPDIPEIARRLNQFKESVRYRYKEKIINRGFAVQGVVDHNRLGLKRLILLADFAPDYRNYAQAILTSMNGLCYLTSFAKTLPKGEYVVNFTVPLDFVEDVKRFFAALEEKGMFTRLQIMDFDWIRVQPMKPEQYDFDTGRWDFDWSAPGRSDFEAANFAPSEVTRFDYVDLLILKELQMDANKSLKEIADNLKLNYKKLAWHYSTHVLANKLIRGYSVNWMGTRYDYKVEKALHRKHRYFAIQLLVRDVTGYETMTLRQALGRLPFLWAEAVGQNYSAEFSFPVDYVVEGLQYIGDAIANVREKAEVLTVDVTNAVAFTIPYALYDQSKKKWGFDQQDLLRRFENLILRIKNETS